MARLSRACAAVEQLEVVAGELRGRECGEHELRVEAEQVEHAAALCGVEGAERMPALGGHEALLDRVRGYFVAAALLGPLDGVAGELAGAAETEWTDAIADRRVGELGQPAGQLHEVTVGVEKAPTGCVRQRGSHVCIVVLLARRVHDATGDRGPDWLRLWSGRPAR